MKKLLIFKNRPDYVFGSDECETVLIWPDVATVKSMDGEETVECLHTAERMADGEIIEYRIFSWPMPGNWEEYDEMIANISSGSWSEMELC